MSSVSTATAPSDVEWQIPAEAITIRVRWFGLAVGYFFVNVLARPPHQAELNAILALGAVYALLDTVWAVRGKTFLSNAPLFISLMEAGFIGMLCWFDKGTDSPFRFYYFLSLLVCAIRYSPTITYATCVFHALSYTVLAVYREPWQSDDFNSFLLMLVFMGWATWACTALTALLKDAGGRLSGLNRELQQNQTELEERIVQRSRQLQESQAMLVQQEKQAAFGLLAAGIAHEVGNPLAAISSIVQLLNRKKLESDMHERLGVIDEQLRRIQGILRELVDFSRPVVKAPALCDVQGVIQSALDVAKYYKRIKGKTVITQFDASPAQVRVVRDRLQQVFLNLILNALDATEEGGELKIATTSTDGFVQIQVIDNGSGIPPAMQQKLFEAYVTTKETGTGLGLFVCRSLMQEARGRILLLESGPGRTVFRVDVPVA